jgi:hypothetical protein
MTFAVGGVGPSAAYKKWEKAAMAGVSLVADAAEELERNMMTQNLSNVDATILASSPNNLSTVDGIVSSVSIVVHLISRLLFLVFVVVHVITRPRLTNANS